MTPQRRVLNIHLYHRAITQKVQPLQLFLLRYNRIPMGMCASSDIFQAKVDGLPGDIEGVKTYINDIIVLGK